MVVIRILLLLLATVLLGWLLFRWLEPRLVFHPYRPWDQDLLTSHPPAREIFFETDDGVKISAVWFPASEPKGSLVYCHGNAGNISHRGHVVEVYRDRLRYSVLLFDYRGYGKSDGTPSEQGILLDTMAAYRQVRALAKNTPVIAGRSLGTVPAVQVAATVPVTALILDSPLSSAADMARRLFPIPGIAKLATFRLDNVANIRDVHCPILILHGDRDSLVPIGQGRKVFEAASSPREFLVLEGQGHNDPRTEEIVVEKLREFLQAARGRQGIETASRP